MKDRHDRAMRRAKTFVEVEMSDIGMKIERRKPTVPAGGVAVLQSGFRPFFLLAAAVGAISVITWLLLLRNVMVASGSLTGVDLHVHEMVFGFVVAVIAGFLLTAVNNWTGIAPASPRILAALAALFLLGRLCIVLEAAGGPRGLSLIEWFFCPVLTAVIARPIIKSRNKKNAGVVAILFVLSCADLAVHLAAWNLWPTIASSARAAALLIPCILLAVIGGRVIPLFTRNVVERQGATVRAFSVVDILAIVSAISVAVLGIFSPFFQPVLSFEAGVAVLAGLLTLLRMRGWASFATLRQPILWVLHIGHFCLGAGYLLRGLSGWFPNVIPSTMATHTLAIGAIALLCMGMMTRVALGHSGRLLMVPRGGVAAYVALLVALLLRLAAPWSSRLLDGAALAFTLACLLFLGAYVRILVTPRLDGRPG